jgi:hypothetical protein
MTTVDAVMAELATHGSEQQRRIYQRHGAPEPQFGVKFADLRAMAKRIARTRTWRSASGPAATRTPASWPA